MKRRSFLSASILAGIWACTDRLRGLPFLPQREPEASLFLLRYNGNCVASLRFSGDEFVTDYIAPGANLGNVEIVWRRKPGSWKNFHSADQQSLIGKPGEYSLSDDQGPAMKLRTRLAIAKGKLRWTVQLRNTSAHAIEVGDLALPLPMHSSFSDKEAPTASVLKHSFISGHGSFLFWMRSNSVGPYLVMTPVDKSALEYWDIFGGKDKDTFRVFLHSRAASEQIQAEGGRWRLPHTSRVLAPSGKPGSTAAYVVEFAWARDYAAVRQYLASVDALDVEVAGGMSVPADLSTMVAIRTRQPVETLTAEHPEDTTIEPLHVKDGWAIYRVTFRRLGENLLTVRQHGGTTWLEFFCSEPVETLVKKRAAFIRMHQVHDPAKWYNGLFAEWNLESGVQLSPDNYDRIKGWRIYEVTCDDPGLSKPAFLATKNAEFPDAAQIEALDYYIEHFVWGGLQRTTEESDSYGIYGIPDWKHNRDSAKPGNDGRRHIWRAYDYPHIVVMYYSMYRIASLYPGIPMKLTRKEYLARAYGTAIGLFTIPLRVTGWSAYETGFYNEAVIPDLIDELEGNGQHEHAAQLRMHWEKKVAFFVTGAPNLFGSEYAFDSTGFESTGVIARYAREHPQTPGTTQASVADFALKQIRANLFCRGVVEKAYYYYGSDYRGTAGNAFTLTYMSPMGGAGVLDHALHDGRDPDATIRLAYASLVSTWSLMNTGTQANNFGYWFPGAANDGGTGGGFEPAAYGETWLGQPSHRGPWYYSSETDLGYCGALRNAATIVADDPIFGLSCFGGIMQAVDGGLTLVAHDGVRRRVSLRTAQHNLDIKVTGARFSSESPMRISNDGRHFQWMLETEAAANGKAQLVLHGLQGDKYQFSAGDTVQEVAGGAKLVVDFEIRPGIKNYPVKLAAL